MNIDVAVSRQFLAWVIALGDGIKIVELKSVIEQMQEEAARLIRQYKEL